MKQVILFVVKGYEKPFREEKIPQQYARLVPPEFVDAQKTPAPVRFINHIVMDQGGRVKQLDHRRCHIAPGGDLTEHPCGHEDERRPDLLALLPEEVADDLVQQDDICINSLPEKLPRSEERRVGNESQWCA